MESGKSGQSSNKAKGKEKMTARALFNDDQDEEMFDAEAHDLGDDQTTSSTPPKDGPRDESQDESQLPFLDLTTLWFDDPKVRSVVSLAKNKGQLPTAPELFLKTHFKELPWKGTMAVNPTAQEIAPDGSTFHIFHAVHALPCFSDVGSDGNQGAGSSGRNGTRDGSSSSSSVKAQMEEMERSIQLPEWLSSSFISYLDLSSNQLTGKLPTWIRNMNLEFLNISNNRFYSTIPVEFKNLYGLSNLDLHSNNFYGPLEVIFNKEGVHYNSIDVSYNKFNGEIDKNIGNIPTMRSITSLILSNYPLGGSIPSSIGNLHKLWVLKMVSNRLTGRIPQELGNAKQLTTILSSRHRLSGSIPKKVLNLANLQEFDVSRNQLSGKIPPHNSSIPASAFSHNLGLCNAPLPSCKN
ncbi:MDIS1-interacting receptor like kinase 2-like [Chenopodium quinoa]|uniref:MDIS1-interacting receptor like kinase 2-like n=1 Tax=Chenopodium quinoa TaxID=63459 RepID=UPI000B7889CE|nr:MDIS1-interacting receptor like kinase 2-like [Chenopodium quinoa]